MKMSRPKPGRKLHEGADVMYCSYISVSQSSLKSCSLTIVLKFRAPRNFVSRFEGSFDHARRVVFGRCVLKSRGPICFVSDSVCRCPKGWFWDISEVLGTLIVCGLDLSCLSKCTKGQMWRNGDGLGRRRSLCLETAPHCGAIHSDKSKGPKNGVLCTTFGGD